MNSHAHLAHFQGEDSIHSNSWIRWMQKSADDFEFSAERLSENAKCIKIIVFAELLTAISSIYVQSLQQIVNKNIKTHYIPKKNATLTPNSCDFYDLLTFVANFFPHNFRTFSAEFWRLKKRNPQTESLLKCMLLCFCWQRNTDNNAEKLVIHIRKLCGKGEAMKILIMRSEMQKAI